MGTAARYEVVAHNTATTSTNKIHDDAIARRYGFSGGLVPGVDVYAYMTRPAAAAWGLDWLGGGTMRARFLLPVYEGETVAVVAREPASSAAGTTMAVEVVGPGGTVRAVGEAGCTTQDRGDDGADPLSMWPVVPQSDNPPPASPESLAAGTALGLAAHRFHAEHAHEYLAEVREELPLYDEAGVAHPGWLLRDANSVLGRNVRLGPWIHVESEVRHHSVVGDGDAVEARAVVTREWDRKGHRFVELDVGLVANDDRLVARITHTAIYRPREPAEA